MPSTLPRKRPEAPAERSGAFEDRQCQPVPVQLSPQLRWMMKPWIDKAIFSLVGLTFMAMMAWGSRDLVFTGKNDFAPLYTGTQLVGTPHLYNAERNLELLEQTVGGVNPSLRYTRLPYHAVFLWPLGQLPYHAAYLIWSLIGLSAIVAFALLWRIPTPLDSVMFTALSLPAFQSVMNGQDTPLLLLWIALAAYWERHEKPFAAGCVLALCAAKYHLLILLPLLFVGQRRWRMMGGFAAAGGVLLVISFAAAGPRWPIEYYRTLTDHRVHPDLAKMPNLHGLLFDLPGAWALQIAAGLAVVVLTWLVVRRTDFLYGLAAVLTGSLLISYHSYLSDCALLLPALTVVYSQTKRRWLQLLSALLLTPFLYFLLIAPRPASYVVQLVIVGFFAGMAWRVFRGAATRETLVTAPSANLLES